MIKYGGFWRRACALVIDTVIFLPLALVYVWLWYESRLLALVANLALTFLGLAYQVVLHGLCGQSVGKMIMGLKVEELGGGRLSWRATWIRFSPVIAFQIAIVIGTSYAIYSVPGDAFEAGSYLQKARLLESGRPEWSHWCTNLLLVWTFAEVIVLLRSQQKRAIHDFLAGTVVRYTKVPLAVSGQQAG